MNEALPVKKYKVIVDDNLSLHGISGLDYQGRQMAALFSRISAMDLANKMENRVLGEIGLT
jgi:hypothetical protein